MVKIVGTRKLESAPFADEVHDMGDFVKQHPEILGEDVVIVSRELEHGLDGRRLDFLVYDTEFNQPGIVELKKDHADEKVLLQTLRYADWLRNNPDTIRYQISRQKLNIDAEEVDIEKIKIFIVAPKIATVVAELAQYISGFDFEFIQLQRFRDSSGDTYAVTIPLEVARRSVSPATQHLEYNTESIVGGVGQEQLERMQSAVENIRAICDDQGWPLLPRNLKGAVKFQTAGGRNVFSIAVRRRQDHYIRFCLGPQFDSKSVEIEDKVRKALQHKPSSRWWSLPLGTGPIEHYRPLLTAAYANVAG